MAQAFADGLKKTINDIPRAHPQICTVCGNPFTLKIEELYLVRDTSAGGIINVIAGEKTLMWDAFDCPACGCQNRVHERLEAFVKIGSIAKAREERNKDKGYVDIMDPAVVFVEDMPYAQCPPEVPFPIPRNDMEKMANEAHNMVLRAGGNLLIKQSKKGTIPIRCKIILSKREGTEILVTTYYGEGDVLSAAICMAYSSYLRQIPEDDEEEETAK